MIDIEKNGQVLLLLALIFAGSLLLAFSLECFLQHRDRRIVQAIPGLTKPPKALAATHPLLTPRKEPLELSTQSLAALKPHPSE